MNEMIKKVRGDKKGFTLAELLIVVAIILVLVAIAVPVFAGAMDQANKSVAAADIRSVKSQAAATYMSKGETGDVVYTAVISTNGDVAFNKAGTAINDWNAVYTAVKDKKPVTVIVKVAKDGTITGPVIPGETTTP